MFVTAATTTICSGVVWLLLSSVPAAALATAANSTLPVISAAANSTLIASAPRSLARPKRFLSEEEACRLDGGACFWDANLRSCRTLYTFDVLTLRLPTYGHYRGPFNDCRRLARRLACSKIPDGPALRNAHFNGCRNRDRRCKLETVAVPPQKCDRPGRHVINNAACVRPGKQHYSDSVFQIGLVCCLSRFNV